MATGGRPPELHRRHPGRAATAGPSRRAIARLFAAKGATVAVHGRDVDALSAVTAQIAQAGGSAMAAVGDLTSDEEVAAMRAVVHERLGPLDILVANAGGNPVPPGPLEAISEAGWRASIDSNLTATFLTIKAFLPGMKARRRGTVITMSSAAARRPTGHSPIAYAAAKAGIDVMTKAIAVQAGPYGVRVNCIAPETILTERNQAQIPEPVQEQLRHAHPIRRLGTPEDVAHAALFLASEGSGWISGTTVDVAGGSVLV